jgi:putative ATP-binding cassette transporter
MPAPERRQRFRWARDFWSLSKPFWTSREGWIAGLQLAFIISVTLTIVYLSVWLNRWYQKFYDIVGTKDPALYFDFLLQYVQVATFWTLIARASYYVRLRLELRWRKSMTTRMVERWVKIHYFWKLTQDPIAQAKWW